MTSGLWEGGMGKKVEPKAGERVCLLCRDIVPEAQARCTAVMDCVQMRVRDIAKERIDG